MSGELNFVHDLAVILISAGVFTIISKALKQPLILGYIIAGFLVGPHVSWFPGITSTESVNQWSEIGIIFLLFALGLEFSFKKLLKVGSSALIMAGTNFVGMFVTGLLVGYLLKWSTMECLFLSGLMSMSSTTIIIKAYDDLGLKQKPYAGLVFGTLVVEDLIAILLMVLLSTLAVSNKFAGGEMLWGLAKLIFFIVLWFLIGIYVIPLMLRKAHKYLNDEIMLIVAIGLCFLMVALASAVGFSSALGAFVMGSILSETVEGERIGHLVKSLKDLFGAVFFVSVGMMVDPAVIGEHLWVILILTVVAMTGIVVFSTTGTLLAGKGLENAVHCGFSLAQLGEFSFIIAGLGCSLGVMRGFIYPIIIAVSVITTFTTPYMIKAADPVYKFLNKKLPKQFLDRINPDPGQAVRKSAAEQSLWKRFLKAYFIRTILYGILLVAIWVGSDQFFEPALEKFLPDVPDIWRNIIAVSVTLIVAAPFLYGFGARPKSIAVPMEELTEEKSNKLPIFALMLVRIVAIIGFVILAVVSHLDLSFWVLLLVVGGIMVFMVFAKRTENRYIHLEKTFMSNLGQKEEAMRRKAPVSSFVNEKMASYDIRTVIVEVSPDYKFVGRMMKEQPFRNESGVNIVKILRGKTEILVPDGKAMIYPHDKLLAVGTAEQTAAFESLMTKYVVEEKQERHSEFAVEKVILDIDSLLQGKTIASLDLRAAGVMIINVIRGESVLTNPRADFRLEVGDVVWLAGDKESISWYM